MPKINLAQETMRNQVVARRRRIIYTISSVLLIVVAAIYFVGFFLTRNVEEKVATVNQRIASLESQLKTKEPGGKEIKAFSSRLVNMKSILKNHIRWSQVLAELERLVLPNVTVKTLKGGTEKSLITLDVNAPTIEAAADLVVSLQNAAGSNVTYFKEVTASALSVIKQTEQVTTTGFSTVLKLGVNSEAFKDSSLLEKTETTVTPVAAVEATPVPAEVSPLTP